MTVRKSIFFIVALALAFVIILAARFFVFSRGSEEANSADNKSESKGTSVIKFPAHKSFLSRKYKFALEYPGDWVLWRNRDPYESERYDRPDFLHEFCFNRVPQGRDLPSDYPFCDFLVVISDAATALPLAATNDAQAVTIGGVRGVKEIDENNNTSVVLYANGKRYDLAAASSPGYGVDVMRSAILPSFEFIHSSGPAVYKSRISPTGGFEVVLPHDYEYLENPDGVAPVIFYWEGATGLEGTGSKVYLLSTQAKSFEDFQKEIKARDADMSGIAYTIGAFGGFQTILAKGYSGIADEMEILYAFIGNGWYYAFVDPPFDLSSLKKI